MCMNLLRITAARKSQALIQAVAERYLQLPPPGPGGTLRFKVAEGLPSIEWVRPQAVSSSSGSLSSQLLLSQVCLVTMYMCMHMILCGECV
jgi:hypothetical protein